MRAIAMMLALTAALGLWADEIEKAAVIALLALVAAVLSLSSRQGWLSRTWNAELDKQQSKIELP